MNQCPACGVANRDSARFCADCGSPISLAPEAAPDLAGLLQAEIDPIREKLTEKYQVLRFIGRGGFSTVFLLKDKALERLCALKILSREQTIHPDSVERFKREARLYASLDHPNIVSVYDFGFHNHVAFIIFKYIDGITLHEHVQRHHPLAQAEILSIASDLANILDYMHRRGVIHRDVKPDNVMVQSSDRKVILTDFGLAKKLDTTTVTSDGKVMGSPHYFSPEQAKGEPVDARSDIYSLGITIFEMASGIVPFKGDTPYEIILKHIREPLPDLSRLRPDLHPDLHKLIRRCSEKEPGRRFQEAVDLREALRRVPPPLPDIKTEIIRRARVHRGDRRRRVRPAFAAAAAAVLLLTTVYLFITRPAKRPEGGMAKAHEVDRPSSTERYDSLIREAQDWLARGELSQASARAAAARQLKAGKEVDELDERIRIRSEAARKKQAEPIAEELLPAGMARVENDRVKPVPSSGGVVAKKSEPKGQVPVPGASPGTKIEEREIAASAAAEKAEPKSRAPGPGAATGTKIEEKGKSAPLPVQAGVAEKPKGVEAARIIDLPEALCQSYLKDLGLISLGALAGEFKVSGVITLAFSIGEAGNVSLKSMNDGGVMIEPESRRPEILESIKNRIHSIKVQPPVDKAGSAVRIENWRITFRIGRDRQVLFLVRIS